MWKWIPIAVLLCVALHACQPAEESISDTEDLVALNPEYGKPLLGVEELGSKDDSLQGSSGLPISVDSSSMAVWDVTNQWEDTDTEQARLSGMAWDADSGLTWNQKYEFWVQSLGLVDAVDNYSTIEITTPYGRTFPAPNLECAEVAIFMRAAFASWYNLPFYISAYTPEGTVYFGHFGIRRKAERYRNMPDFKTKYPDYSGLSAAEYTQNWPSDASLAKRFLTSSKDDENLFLGEGRYSGAYFDQMFLNKRAGHFMLYLLTYVGSIHLASPTNLYNVKAEAVQAGDVLLHRWQKSGVGHAMLVKSVISLVSQQLEAELVSGNMPRRQPRWQSASASKYNFTKAKAGGPGISADGYAYAALGGGLKRWRIAKVTDGKYYNRVPESDTDVFIGSKSHVKLADRVNAFDSILGALSPVDTRAVLIQLIEESRQHLRNYPASCSARSKREAVFQELYSLSEEHFGMTAAEVDAGHRIFEDFVFAELEYAESRTCCWNSTNSAMYASIVAYAQEETFADGVCTPPPVFKMVDGAYTPFEDYAEVNGVPWVAWSADEFCPWAEYVTTDTEAPLGGGAEFCSLAWPELEQASIELEEGEEEVVEEVVEEEVSETDQGCFISDEPGCPGCLCEACVCGSDSYCCSTAWDEYCVASCKDDCGVDCP